MATDRGTHIVPRDLVKEARENVAIYRDHLDTQPDGDRWIGHIAAHHLLDLIEDLADALCLRKPRKRD